MIPREQRWCFKQWKGRRIYEIERNGGERSGRLCGGGGVLKERERESRLGKIVYQQRTGSKIDEQTQFFKGKSYVEIGFDLQVTGCSLYFLG